MKRVFQPSDIKWFKNVTNTEGGSAYMDKKSGQFTLHFPKNCGNNVKNPEIDDVIILYQRINNVELLTHLVTPISKELDNTGIKKYPSGREVVVLAATEDHSAIMVSETIFNKYRLSGVARGMACKIQNMKPVINEEEILLEIQNDIYDKFLPYLKDEWKHCVSLLIPELACELNDKMNRGVIEGASKLVSHCLKERNPGIVQEKKNTAFSIGKYECEVCNFSFKKVYDEEFIECHHIRPISNGGERETNLNDLSLVCANCHRMLHKRINGQYLTIEQLRTKIGKRK
jgi:hypothetical protein